MKMSRNFPIPVQEQQGFLGFPSGLVLGNDLVGGLSPNLARTVCLSKDISLIVRVVVDKDTCETAQKECRRPEGGPIGTMLDEVKGVRGVHGRNPNETSPAQVIAGTVVLNVHRAHVSHFPVVEFRQVDELNGDVDCHTELEISSIQFLIFEGKAQDSHDPKHHPGAAVGKHFDIPSENVRVQIHTPIKVVDPTTRRPTVSGGGRHMTLDEQNRTQDPGKDIHAGEDISKLIIDQGGLDDPIVGQPEEGNNRDKVGLETIGCVDGNIPLGGHGSLKEFGGKESLQQELESQKGTNHLPGFRIQRVGPNGHQNMEEALIHTELCEG